MQSPGKLRWQLKSAHQPLLARLGQAGEEEGFLRLYPLGLAHAWLQTQAWIYED